MNSGGAKARTTLEKELYVNVLHNVVSSVSSILKRKGVDVNWRNPEDDHRTALHVACYFAHSEIAIVYLLQTTDINMNVRDDLGETPFFAACRCIRSKTRMMKDLLEDARVDTSLPNNDGITPLWLCVDQEDLEVIEWMLIIRGYLDLEPRTLSTLAANPDTSVYELAQSKGGPILLLFDEYRQDPKQCRDRLKTKYGLQGLCFIIFFLLRSQIILGDFNTTRCSQVPGSSSGLR